MMKVFASRIIPGNSGYNGLTIESTPILLPNQISAANSVVGNFGVNLIHLAISLAILAATLLVLVFVLYGGWKWMTSEGDKKKIEDARTTIIYAVIGLVVIILSFLVINVIGAFFHVDLLQIG